MRRGGREADDGYRETQGSGDMSETPRLTTWSGKRVRRMGAALVGAAALAAGTSGFAGAPSWEHLPFTGMPSFLHGDGPPEPWRPVWALEIRNTNGGAILLHRSGR